MHPEDELEALYTRINPQLSVGWFSKGTRNKMFRLVNKGVREWTVDGVLSKADTIMKIILLVSVIGILTVILLGLIIPQAVYLQPQ
jgi:hypothetical protein